MEIGSKIKEARLRIEYTQEQVAESFEDNINWNIYHIVGSVSHLVLDWTQ